MNLIPTFRSAVKDGLETTAYAALSILIIFWAIPMAAGHHSRSSARCVHSHLFDLLLGGALANLEELGNDYSWLSGVTRLPTYGRTQSVRRPAVTNIPFQSRHRNH